MNLNMIRANNETEDLLLSIIKNCETLNKVIGDQKKLLISELSKQEVHFISIYQSQLKAPGR